MKITKDDEGSKIWQNNKMIGFVDENEVLHGVDPETDHSYEICPIVHEGEISKLLSQWLKSRKSKT